MEDYRKADGRKKSSGREVGFCEYFCLCVVLVCDLLDWCYGEDGC